MNSVFLDLGFFTIYWYSVIMLVAVLTGSFLFYKILKKKKLSDYHITNILFYAIICGIIGARLYYCIFNLSYYLEYPIEIFEVWQGGLAIHGAIIGGVIAILVYCYKYKLNVLKITDAASICVILSQAIGRWGNFFNSEAHGGITTLETLKSMLIPNFIIKGMFIDGNYYLPTFYFESIWNILGFILLFTLYKKVRKLNVGSLTVVYFMWYSFGRFFIEGLRTDSLMISGISVIILGLIIVLLVLYLLFKKKNIISKKLFIISGGLLTIIVISLMLIIKIDFYIRVAQLISILLFGSGLMYLIYNRKDTRVKRLERK